MVKSKSPKVFSYFLFMQEQRKKVPGWANKTNNELQALCDPMWRKLDKEEKDKYKQMKKSYKDRERMETEERFASLMHTGLKTSVVVGHVEKPDIVWVVKTKDMDFVQNQLSNITMVPIDVVKVGTVAACKFSEDGVVYRAMVLSIESSNKVMIRYMEFGNSEMVDQKELCNLPSSLGKVGPLAVKVRLVGMEGVKNSEKNRRKVEKKLDVDNLEVSVDKEWLATFYSSGVALRFKGSKAERNEINHNEETIQGQDEDKSEVEAAVLVSAGNVEAVVDESRVEKLDSLKDDNFNLEIVKVEDGENNLKTCDEMFVVADVYASNDGEEDASVDKSSSSAETDSGMGISMTMLSLGIGSEYKANDIEDNVDGVGTVDESIVTKEESVSSTSKSVLSFHETETAEIKDREEIFVDRKKDYVVEVPRKKKVQNTIVGKYRNTRSKKIADRNKKTENESGWKVNDSVIAQWEDGVWRQGVLHEVIDGMAFVVSKEEMVKATKVKLAKLRNATIPVDVLNMLEEELVYGNESSSDENSSIMSSSDEAELVHFSEDLDDLLTLLPLIDIETLTSPSCADLISSLVLVIPTLPVYQLDVLVESMIVHDLLIPAALHSETSLIARELVSSVMKSTSAKRGQVLNSLAMHADELQLNACGKEVLKTLQGYF